MEKRGTRKSESRAGSASEHVPSEAEAVVDRVRERYGRLARAMDDNDEGCGCSCCCGPSDADAVMAQTLGYSASDVESVPKGAKSSLGCGAPVRHLDPKPGETVLDLGSGAGFDAILTASAVGPRGRVIGVDMTPEMIERAESNAAEDGLDNVEFRLGRLEALPVDDGSVDAVISNCVINLVPDKSRVFAEAARVLRPGGRMVVSDIILDGELPEAVRSDLLAYVGCISGAMQRTEYFGAVRSAGFSDVTVLSDVDYTSVVDCIDRGALRSIADRVGIDVGALSGRVRSVTFRAVK